LKGKQYKLIELKNRTKQRGNPHRMKKSQKSIERIAEENMRKVMIFSIQQRIWIGNWSIFGIWAKK
jgi:hypothetical protein